MACGSGATARHRRRVRPNTPHPLCPPLPHASEGGMEAELPPNAEGGRTAVRPYDTRPLSNSRCPPLEPGVATCAEGSYSA